MQTKTAMEQAADGFSVIGSLVQAAEESLELATVASDKSRAEDPSAIEFVVQEVGPLGATFLRAKAEGLYVEIDLLPNEDEMDSLRLARTCRKAALCRKAAELLEARGR